MQRDEAVSHIRARLAKAAALGYDRYTFFVEALRAVGMEVKAEMPVIQCMTAKVSAHMETVDV